MMRQVEAFGWTSNPYAADPYDGLPKVTRVTLRGLGGMSLEEAVCKGIFSSKGFDEKAFRRALLLRDGHTLPPHSEYDEHGFPVG